MDPHRVLFGFRAAFVFGAVLAMSAAPAQAAESLFSVSGIKVDATAASATEARDIAIAQGRSKAWAKLYRRLAREKDWPRQPQLDDTTLLRMVRGIEIANEKRSSTRYLADITYEFNPGDVRRILQQGGVAYTESSGKRVLIIPVVAGSSKPYDSSGAWTKAWSTADLGGGVVPIVLPSGSGADMDVLARSDLPRLRWESLSAIATRYNASEVLIAEAVSMQGAIAVTLTRVTPSSAAAAPPLPPQPNYSTAAQATATAIREAWKGRAAINYGQKTKLMVLVSFSSGREWTSIRQRLASVQVVSDVSVVALTLNSAQIEISYMGQLAQLQEALEDQSLSLSMGSSMYVLRYGAAAP